MCGTRFIGSNDVHSVRCVVPNVPTVREKEELPGRRSHMPDDRENLIRRLSQVFASPKPAALKNLKVTTEFCSRGDFFLPIVGEASYQPTLLKAKNNADGREVVVFLTPEPSNPYDRSAIAVWCQEGQIGYLSRQIATQLEEKMNTFIDANNGAFPSCMGRIYGGEGERKSIGVWLDLDCGAMGMERLAVGDREYKW